MNLIPFEKPDFPNFRSDSILNFAKDLAVVANCSFDVARKMAETQFDTLLPNGVDTQDNYFVSALDSKGNKMGYLWYGIRNESGMKRMFIFEIFLESKFRGQGFGTKIMTWLEGETKKLGLNEIRLHVFAHNEKARRLYKMLGFAETNVHMSKKLK